MSSKREDAMRSGIVPTFRFPAFLGQPIHDVQLRDVTEESTTRNGGKLARAAVMGVRKEGGIVPMEERLVAGDIARYKIVHSNWFAYNPMRLNIGSIGRWQGDDEILVSPDYVVFRCSTGSNPTPLLPAYLDHFRNSMQWEAFTNASGDGGVRIRIYYRDLAQMRLLLPDADEQQKIADCLSSIDALIAAEADKLEALRDHKQGLLQQLFPAPGEATPRLRFPEFQDAGDWKQSTLGEFSSMKAGKFVAAADILEKPAGNLHPCYGGNGLRGYTRTFTHSGKYALIGRQGALCGNVNFVTGHFHATEHAIVATPKKGVLIEWLFHALDRLKLNGFATGQAQPGLSVDVLEKIACSVPQDKHEQQLIADCLNSVDSGIAIQGDKIDALKTHKMGLMQQLFPVVDETQV
jgi:type I restriction enzyme, S subunit